MTKILHFNLTGTDLRVFWQQIIKFSNYCKFKKNKKKSLTFCFKIWNGQEIFNWIIFMISCYMCFFPGVGSLTGLWWLTQHHTYHTLYPVCDCDVCLHQQTHIQMSRWSMQSGPWCYLQIPTCQPSTGRPLQKGLADKLVPEYQCW